MRARAWMLSAFVPVLLGCEVEYGIETNCGESPREWKGREGVDAHARIALAIERISDSEDFGFITDASFGQNGTVYVADAIRAQVLVFDSTGRARGAVGGRGEGPGEFQAITNVLGTENGFEVFDARLWRRTAFDAAGSVRGIQSMTLQVDFGQHPQVALGATDTYILGFSSFASSVVHEARGREAVVVRGLNSIERWDEAEGRWRVVVDSLSGESVLVSDGAIKSVPFSPKLLWAASDRDGIWHADSEVYRLYHLDPTRARRCEIRVPFDPVRVTQSERDDFYDATEVAKSKPERIAEVRAGRRHVPVPEYKPALKELLLARTGEVWVLPQADDSLLVWQTFSPEGRPLRNVTIPPQLRVLEIGGARGLAVGETLSGAHVLYILTWSPSEVRGEDGPL